MAGRRVSKVQMNELPETGLETLAAFSTARLQTCAGICCVVICMTGSSTLTAWVPTRMFRKERSMLRMSFQFR